jgi:Fur family transcriptional regulator, zinc uptake regulator
MKHNHQHCIHSALERAIALHGKALTPLRTQVLEALWGAHKAFGAYDLLHALNQKAKKKLAPLSVYRALEFLVTAGLAHRIESLNAYVGCPHPEAQHALQFLICNNCKSVTEIADGQISKALVKSAAAQNFTPARSVVEVLGQCQTCASRS